MYGVVGGEVGILIGGEMFMSWWFIWKKWEFFIEVYFVGMLKMVVDKMLLSDLWFVVFDVEMIGFDFVKDWMFLLVLIEVKGGCL